MIAALAVSASLAVSVAERKEPTAEASRVVAHKHHAPENYAYVSEAVGGPSSSSSSAHGLAEIGLAGLLDVISLPKKYLGAAAAVVVAKLKTLDTKKLLKGALLIALVTVLGAVAAVAVAGLVSLVSGICAIAPYLRFFMGGVGGGEMSETNIDSIGNFVLGAFNKYEMQQHQQHKA